MPCFILFPGLTQAQQKVFFGVESGLSLGYINMGKFKGTGFRNTHTFALAPTGITISKELKSKWLLEIGACFQTFVNSGYGFNEEYAPDKFFMKRNYSGTDSRAFGFKLIRFNKSDHKVIFSPHLGLTHCSVNQLNSIKENFQSYNSGASTVNGITVTDTMFRSTLYTTNNFLGIDLGLRTWFKLSNRSYFTFDISYFTNPGAALSFETYTYVKTGNNPINGVSVHKAKNLYFQVGYRWHWKDLHPVKPGAIKKPL